MVDKLENLLDSLNRSGATWQVMESVLRKFVAGNPDEYRAWLALLKILTLNESWRELSRLADEAAQKFPDDVYLPFAAAVGMANLLEVKQALKKLIPKRERFDKFVPAHHLLGELLLVSNPALAEIEFKSLLSKKPSYALAQIGLASANSLMSGRGGAEVVLFQAYGWHRSIQQPLFDELTHRGIGAVMTQSAWIISALRPKLLVVSDVPQNLIRRIKYGLPNTRIINTRHGLGDKNYAYYASTIVDYVCVSSEHVARAQISSGCINPASVWVTGFCQMDPIFRKIDTTTASGSVTSPHIVFAPTFTSGLNSGELIGEDPATALRGDRTDWLLTVRPHPHMTKSHPDLLNAWQRSLAKTVNATLDLDFDRSPADLLCSADLLVSDVSSMALQFLALDRPIVCLLEDKLATSSPFFAPDSYEIQLTSAALKVSKKKYLAEAVRCSLELGQSVSIVSNRKALANELFGTLRDGRAAIRIAEKIEQLLDEV